MYLPDPRKNSLLNAPVAPASLPAPVVHVAPQPLPVRLPMPKAHASPDIVAATERRAKWLDARARNVGQRPPRPRRAHAEAPRPSNQYVKAISTEGFCDKRLPPLARCMLAVIKAVASERGAAAVTYGYLSLKLGITRRHAMRLVGEAVELGYITKSISKTRGGKHSGLLILATEKLAPFFERTAALAQWCAARLMPALQTLREADTDLGVTCRTPNNQFRYKNSDSEGLRRPRISV